MGAAEPSTLLRSEAMVCGGTSRSEPRPSGNWEVTIHCAVCSHGFFSDNYKLAKTWLPSSLKPRLGIKAQKLTHSSTRVN